MYQQQQLIWYLFLTEGLLRIISIVFLVLIVKKILGIKTVFKAIAFLLFVVPITVLVIIARIRGQEILEEKKVVIIGSLFYFWRK